MTTTREISLGAIRLGGGNPLFLIAGPCVIESEAHARKIAEQVARKREATLELVKIRPRQGV